MSHAALERGCRATINPEFPSFPALNLEQVYGAIAFYLSHRDTIDAYLRAGKADFVRLREQARRDHPSLYAKIEAAREGTVIPRG